MALRPGCVNEPVRLGHGRRRRSPGLFVVAVVATWCIAMLSGTTARPQQPVLPAADAHSHVQGASQTSQSVVDSASARDINSEWRGVVHSWPGQSSYDQLGRSVVYSSDPEATWLNQRTSRVEKTSNQPPIVHQPPPPTAPLGASLQAVATQLMAHVASPSPTPSSSTTPGLAPTRQPDPEVRMDPESGFQGVAEPLDVNHNSPSTPRPPSSVLPSSLKPQQQRPLPLTTIQPQPSTTASERISTWILLSGPHGTSTTPSATTFTTIPPSGSTTSSSAQKKTPGPSTHNQSPPASPKPVPQKAAAKRPATPGPNQPTRKPVAFTKKPSTTTTAAPSSAAPSTELVKIAETVSTSLHKSKLPATAAEQTAKKPGKPNNATAAAKRPATTSTPSSTTASPVTPVPADKIKVSTATVPVTPALAFRRRPADGKHRVTTVAPMSSTTSTTPAPTTVEDATTLPSTLPDDTAATTKRPKRPSSTHKKNKKKKKNRRRRPTKKTTTAVATTKPESKIGHDSNFSKPGQNGISTKIYNYLAREVMPSVSVGIIGLVVTAGLAGLFLYPFGGGVAARRHDEHLGPHGRLPPDRNYYYERDYPPMANEGSTSPGGKAEEEIIGQVFAGMQQQPETRYGYGPPIYGGGNSGPPDAQYSDSYDKTRLGSSSEPEEERPGEGEVKTYADPSPIISGSDSLQKTRYDVATPADQVDITYPPTKKEESPYVVGSIAANDASAYHYTGDANATVESAEGNPKSAGSRYSVRVNGESGQVALGYGAQSGATGSVENADLGSSLELSYSGSGGAQPRRLKSRRRRRRRQVTASLVDSKQNELDGPVPEDKRVYITSTTPETTTEVPTTVPATEEVPTTTIVNSAGKEVVVEVVASPTSIPSPSTTITTKTPSSTAFTPVQTTDDPLASLVSLLKRLAEYKLRLGANFLRGTSDAVTRYLGGVARRMEAAVAHLSDDTRSRSRARRWEPFRVPRSPPKQERAPPPSRAKHILKKATLTKAWQ